MILPSTLIFLSLTYNLSVSAFKCEFGAFLSIFRLSVLPLPFLNLPFLLFVVVNDVACKEKDLTCRHFHHLIITQSEMLNNRFNELENPVYCRWRLFLCSSDNPFISVIFLVCSAK